MIFFPERTDTSRDGISPQIIEWRFAQSDTQRAFGASGFAAARRAAELRLAETRPAFDIHDIFGLLVDSGTVTRAAADRLLAAEIDAEFDIEDADATAAAIPQRYRITYRTLAADLAQLYGLVAPNYAAVMESYVRAQQAARATG